MSERAHASEPLEADDSSPSTSPRRPSALPIARLGSIESAPVAPRRPVEAPREQPKPAERPPLVLFDRVVDAQVSIPDRMPEPVHEDIKRNLEADAEKTADDDDDDAEAVPAVSRTETVDTEPAEHPVEPDGFQQYAVPVIPPVAHGADDLSSRPKLAFERPAAEIVETAAADTQSEDPFEKMMSEAGLDPLFNEAVSGDRLGEVTNESDQLVHSAAGRVEDPYAVQASAARPLPGGAAVNGPRPVFGPSHTSAYNQPPAPPQPPAAGGGGGGNRRPPTGPGGPGPGSSSGGMGHPGGPIVPGGAGFNGNNYPTPAAYAANMPPNPNAIQAPPGYTDDDLHRARTSGLRQGLLTGAIAGGLAGRFFANRKARKEQIKRDREHAAELDKRDAIQDRHEREITELKTTPDIRDAITGQVAGPSAEVVPEPSAAPVAERPRPMAAPLRTVEVAPVAAAAGRAETPVVVQPEALTLEAAEAQPQDPFERQSEEPHHTIRSEWLEIGVDKSGRVVQQEYGRAFQEETRQEQTGNRTSTNDPAGDKRSSDATKNQPRSAGYYIGGPLMGVNDRHQGESGQLPIEQRLQPSASTPQNQQPSVPSPKKQVASNVGNPWFWLMCAVVIVIVFAAAAL